MASGITMDQAMKEVTDAGFPPLGVFKMMTPATVSIFVKKEVAMRNVFCFITPMELQVIYTVVSAANNCEMSLSFCQASANLPFCSFVLGFMHTCPRRI
jgi:hypothetical protein